MVSVEAVEFAYRLILGREPESGAVVERLAKNAVSVADLGTKFFQSAEFKAKLAQGAGRAGAASLIARKPLDWAPIHVQVDVSDEDLTAMVRHVEASWEELGRVEPHWSVLTHEKFRAATIGENEEAFYASGETAANALSASACRYGVALEAYRDCFELGCGVGRVTRWLSAMFPRVLACDISAPHLELCKAAIERHSCSNVELLKLGALADLADLDEFDVFFSVIVLQHNPPPVIAYMLKTILGKLRPGGIGYFQVPTYSVGYKFDLNYLPGLKNTGSMEMHVLPQNALFELIQECGCQLIEVREDGWTGAPTMVSNSVLVRKRSAVPFGKKTEVPCQCAVEGQ
jgi:SAM-dependent methyltransferase